MTNVSPLSRRDSAFAAPVEPEKFLHTCAWPSIRNGERLHSLTQTWATWKGMDVTNFIRCAVAFFIVVSFVFDLFAREKLNAFYKLDRAWPLDQ